MGNHAPTIFPTGENVGGKGAEIGSLSGDHAGDPFNTGDTAEIVLDNNVQLPYLELHKIGISEDTVPTHAHRFPADQR